MLDSTLEHAGLGKEKLQRFLNPPPFEPQGGTMPQPAYNARLQPGLPEGMRKVLSAPKALAQLEEEQCKANAISRIPLTRSGVRFATHTDQC